MAVQSVRMRSWRYVILSVMALASFLPLQAASAAQAAPMTLSIQAAFNGVYRAGEWFPVDVQVANDGPDVSGVLEWNFPALPDETRFEQSIELPRGARKRVTLYVFSRGFARSGQIRLLDGTTVLAQQTVRIEAIDTTIFLTGVVSSDATLLTSLNSLQMAGFSGTSVPHFGIDMLPERAVALTSLNALFLHNIDTSGLRKAQHEAIDLWVQQGGQLIVSGGINAAQTAAGVADLLPVEIDGGLTPGSLAVLQSFGGSAPTVQDTALSNVRPRQGATPIAATTGGPALLYRWTHGKGSVIFTTFDLASLRGWSGEVALWQSVLKPFSPRTTLADDRLSRNNPLERVLHSPASNLPSAGLLLVLLAIYLLAIGPANFLLLRRLGRLDWAWLTIPAVVVLFSAAFYLVGFGIRGSLSQLDQVAIVNGTEGQPRGTATAFIGLFSPRRARYTVDFPAETLISEARSWRDDNGAVTTVRYTDGATEVPDVLVDVGSVRTLAAETAVDMPVQVQSTLRVENGNVVGSVRSTGGETLQDVLIVRGNAFQSLGTLAPGTNQQVSFSTASSNFPEQVDVQPAGAIQRQELLSTLFSNGSSIAPSSNDEGIYLLGWRLTPTVSLRLNGQDAAQAGVTLYIIRLAGP
ncbi:MAG TPA: hypothetical protein VFT66_24900 [Roseiflexaceae bacterium]|nr:hypothetical protein [Roseiflexaceae bacterium]